MAVFDWFTLDFFCLTLQAMVFDFLYCLSHCVGFIVNFIMYGIVAELVYQFTRFIGEITAVYSDIGAWHCEFVYMGVHLCYDHILVQRMYILWVWRDQQC